MNAYNAGFSQDSPWCPHGINKNEQRCRQCQPYSFGHAVYLGESHESMVITKLDAIYSKLEAIERRLDVPTDG